MWSCFFERENLQQFSMVKNNREKVSSDFTEVTPRSIQNRPQLENLEL